MWSPFEFRASRNKAKRRFASWPNKCDAQHVHFGTRLNQTDPPTVVEWATSFGRFQCGAQRVRFGTASPRGPTTLPSLAAWLLAYQLGARSVHFGAPNQTAPARCAPFTAVRPRGLLPTPAFDVILLFVVMRCQSNVGDATVLCCYSAVARLAFAA